MADIPATARRALDACGGEPTPCPSRRVVSPKWKDGTPSGWPVLIDLLVHDGTVESASAPSPALS